MKGLPLEFGIGVRGPKCLNDGATRRCKKFSGRFSRFDTILAVTDTQPPSLPPSHVAVAYSNFSLVYFLRFIYGLVTLTVALAQR